MFLPIVHMSEQARRRSKPRQRRFVMLVLGLALTLTACGVSSQTSPSSTPTPKPTATATPTPCASWRIVSSPNATKWQDNGLASVSALSSTAAWAVEGNSGPGTVGPVASLIEQWDGSSWQIVTNPGVAFLSGVAAVSATDVWAVGKQWDSVSMAYKTFTMHWNGSQWSAIPSVNPSSVENVFTSVVAVSASEVWAVGHYSASGSGAFPLIERWDGSAWHVVTNPAVPGTQHGFLSVVASIPGTQQLWTVGYTTAAGSSLPIQPLIERWNGSVWQIVANPTLPSGATQTEALGVVALSATDAWLVGDYHPSQHPLTAHWDGATWSVVASPDVKGSLVSIAATGPSDVRAAGYLYQGSDQHALTERWDGAAWQVMTSPEPSGTLQSNLSGITTDGMGAFWAVGSFFGAGSYDSKTLALHCL